MKKTAIQKLKLAALALAGLLSILQPLNVFAVPYDRAFFSGNDILYHGPADCSAESGGSATLVGNDNAERIWNFLVGNDGNLDEKERLSAEQAAGVMGNIAEESSYKPDITEIGGGGGYGIVQWTAGRRTQLEDAAKKAGVKPSDLGFQLNYMFEESNSRTVTARDFKSRAVDNNEWKTLQNLDSIEDSALFWHQNFEISNDNLSQIQERVTSAKDAYASFKDNVPSGGGGGSSTSSKCDDAAGGNFEETVLAFAWPQYEAGKTQNTPAYQKAMEKAADNAQYLGANVGSQLGIDCGAFVTRLMIDSGFEPKYNYGGKLADGAGNTTAQERWLKANWKVVGKGNQVKVGGDTSDEKVLRAGDVAIDANHTFVFVGDIKGFDSNTASASLREHSPMAGKDPITDARWTWYRKK